MKANGVTTLTPGQTITIPKAGGGLLDPLNPNATNPLFNPNYVQEQMAVSGSNEPYRGQPAVLGKYNEAFKSNIEIGGGLNFNAPVTKTSGGYLPSPTRTPQFGQLDGGTSRFNEPLPLPQNQPIGAKVGAQIYTGFQTPTSSTPPNPNQADESRFVQPPRANPSAVVPQGYVYTGGNDPLAVQQRAIWNMQAGASPQRALELAQNRVIPLTRNQVWNMKANQRRRNASQEQPQAVAPVAVNPLVGNAVNTNISWRVGG